MARCRTKLLLGGAIVNGAWMVSLVIRYHLRNSCLLRVVTELEAVLVLCGAIIPAAIPESDRNQRDMDSEDESEGERQRSRYGSRGAPRRTAKAKKDEDSGSELDM